MSLFKIFLAGLIISFLGSLPLGTVNIAAMQIAITNSSSEALIFAFGCLIVEITYIRLTLVMVNKVIRHENILKKLEWISFIIIVALAISAFTTTQEYNSPISGKIILSDVIPPFFLGILLMGANTVQIPFWLGWSTILFDKKILKPRSSYYNSYVVGIGLGSFLGSCVFIFAGQFITNHFQTKQGMLHYFIGGIFTLTALIQLYKILKRKKLPTSKVSKKLIRRLKTF